MPDTAINTTVDTTRFVRRGDGPDPVDIHVGKRLRLCRKTLGLSQEELGARIGVTFQQLQKYESGRNRVSCSMLDRLCKALDLPYEFFFEGLRSGGADDAEADEMKPDGRRQSRAGLTLLRNFDHCPPEVQGRITDLMKAIASATRP